MSDPYSNDQVTYFKEERTGKYYPLILWKETQISNLSQIKYARQMSLGQSSFKKENNIAPKKNTWKIYKIITKGAKLALLERNIRHWEKTAL